MQCAAASAVLAVKKVLQCKQMGTAVVQQAFSVDAANAVA